MNFIHIQAERFYGLLSGIMDKVSQNKYEQLYVTLSGVVGHNYGNVMSIVLKVAYKKGAVRFHLEECPKKRCGSMKDALVIFYCILGNCETSSQS